MDVTLLDDISSEMKKIKEKNKVIQNRIKKLSNINYTEINDKETADIFLNVINTYFYEFNKLDLKEKRNLIKLLIGTIISDGKDITINFIDARF